MGPPLRILSAPPPDIDIGLCLPHFLKAHPNQSNSILDNIRKIEYNIYIQKIN
jgi:hypothetical protein